MPCCHSWLGTGVICDAWALEVALIPASVILNRAKNLCSCFVQELRRFFSRKAGSE
jgi:hypothetical protein